MAKFLNLLLFFKNKSIISALWKVEVELVETKFDN